MNRLATDRFFRELVRAIVALDYTKVAMGYKKDPDEWDREIQKAVEEIVPKKDIESYRKAILKRDPHSKSLADFFNKLKPRNYQKLKNMVKSTYEGYSQPEKELGKPLKEKKEEKVEQGLTDEEFYSMIKNRELGKSEDLWKSVQEARSERLALSRTAALKIINDYLNTFDEE